MNVTEPAPAVRKSSSARRDDPDVNRWVAMLSAELDTEDRPQSSRPSSATQNSQIEISLELGQTRLPHATHELTPGDMLQLDQRADEPIDLVAAGRIIARGELLVVAGKIGVRIVELLLFLIGFCGLAIDRGFADEPARSGKPTRTIDRLGEDTEDVIKTPFGTTHGRRSTSQTTDIMPREPRSNSESRVNSEARSSFEADPFENISRTTDDLRSVPLTKPSAARRNSRSNADSNSEPNKPTGGDWGTTIWALLAVVGSIAAGAHWLKSRVVPGTKGLPDEAWEVLGREPFDVRTSVLLVRCGSRLLLLSSSSNGLQTLAQITDPVEIDCLAGLCRSTQRDHGLTETFRSLIARPATSKPEAEASRVMNTSSPLAFADRRQSLPIRPVTTASPEARS